MAQTDEDADGERRNGPVFCGRSRRDRPGLAAQHGYFLTLGVLAVPFLLLVTDNCGPLTEADRGARDALHVFALGHSWFRATMRTFSDSGSSLAWQIFSVVVALVLLLRRK